MYRCELGPSFPATASRTNMKPVNMLVRLPMVVILVLVGTVLVSPSIALAQTTWHSDQLIEDNTGYDASYPYVAMFR